jgi:hypothetical protein
MMYDGMMDAFGRAIDRLGKEVTDNCIGEAKA